LKVLGLEKSISDISATRLPYPFSMLLPGLGSRLCAPLFQAVCLYRYILKRAFVSSHIKYALTLTRSQGVRSIFLHFYTFVLLHFYTKSKKIMTIDQYGPHLLPSLRRYFCRILVILGKKSQCAATGKGAGNILIETGRMILKTTKKHGNNVLRGAPCSH